MGDFHTIRLNGPDYLLFLKAKTWLIERLEQDLQNNDVFHEVIIYFNAKRMIEHGLRKMPNIEEE